MGRQALSTWTAQRVLDAAAAMEFVPEGAIEVRTDDYRLVRHPDWVLGPTLGAAQVTWSRTARPLHDVIDEVAARVRGWGLPGTAWWVSSVSQPAGTEEALRDRGAELIDAWQVLARELDDDQPQIEVPGAVVVELVHDERTFRGARQLPGRTRRTAPAGPRARRHPGPGKRPRPGLGADPAAGRVRGLRGETLLLAADYLVPPLPPAECPILRVVHELRACCHAPMTEVKQETTSLDALAEIERQVLWLSTAIVHHANRVRPNLGGLKVGGHQASSASMVSIMTSLWFRHLRAEDRVSVKPHASPVLHAINYLLGELDESYLPTLRAYRGLQSYPSRVKDPDPVDYSTGSVGIGATAPIWGAVARRYLRGMPGAEQGRAG